MITTDVDGARLDHSIRCGDCVSRREQICIWEALLAVTGFLSTIIAGRAADAVRGMVILSITTFDADGAKMTVVPETTAALPGERVFPPMMYCEALLAESIAPPMAIAGSDGFAGCLRGILLPPMITW